MIVEKIHILIIISLFPFKFESQITISQSGEQELLIDALNKISSNYDVYFSYDQKKLRKLKVSYESTNQPIEDFLNQVLENHNLKYKKSSEKFYAIYDNARKIYISIINKSTGKPVSYATVKYKKSYKGTSVNNEGNGSINARIDEKLEVSSIGYKNLEIETKGKDSLIVYLTEDTVLLNGFKVMEYLNRTILIDQDPSSLTIDVANLEILPGLVENDVLLSCQMIPGFESNDETAGGINVRGSSSDQTLMYWDRIPIYLPAHYFGHITSIIPNAVNKLTTYKNYVPANFTGASSGLLEIKCFDSVKQKLKTAGNINFTHADISMTFSLNNKLDFIIAGRSTFNEIIKTPLFDSYNAKLFDDFEEDVLMNDDDINYSLDFKDLNSKLIFKVTPKSYLSVSLLFNDDLHDLNISLPEENQNFNQTQRSLNKGINLFYCQKLNNNFETNLSLSTVDYELNNEVFLYENEDDIIEENTILNELSNIEGKFAFLKKLNNTVKYELGYQFNRFQTNLEYNEKLEFEENIQDSLFTTEMLNSLHFKSNMRLKKWKLSPQVRINYYDNDGELLIHPILNSSYAINKNVWLKFSVGQYSQALRSLNENDIKVSNINSSIWLLSDNDDLDVIKSWQLSSGLLLNERGFLIDLDAYYKVSSGVSALNLFSETEGELDFSNGLTYSYGVELMLRKRFSNFILWNKYTWSKTINEFQEIIDGKQFFSPLDRRHQLRFGASYTFNEFEFSLGYIFKTGTPYTIPNGYLYDPIEDNYSLNYTHISNSRLPSYSRLDASFWYKFPNEKRKINGKIGFSFMNILNRENVWRRYYILQDFDDNNTPEIEEVENYYLGFSPNISLKLFFN